METEMWVVAREGTIIGVFALDHWSDASKFADDEDADHIYRDWRHVPIMAPMQQ